MALSSPSRNHIPSGRQLPRTPPLNDFSPSDFEEKQPVEAELRNNEELDLSSLKTEPEWSMLKGMKGYQMTTDDLDFITKLKKEQLIKKLKKDLEDVQKLLKKETTALEMACASRDKVQAELNKLLSSEDIIMRVNVVFKVISLQVNLKGMNARSLLDMVTVEDIQRTVEQKKSELTRMRKIKEERRRKEAEERGVIEKQITSEQVKIQELMRELSNLKSELAQEKEVSKSLKKLLPTQEAAGDHPSGQGNKSKQRRGGKNAADKPARSKNAHRKAEETQEEPKQSKAKESVPAVRGRGKAATPVEAPSHSRRGAAADVAPETVHGLRRSKRIANRR
ncbi:plectin-like [Parambassis ranga]|uniref:Plectin-like n=1 Tax=Parambassis ranga TaxID=210632 RepID=A0A6P7HJV9_9TELE|nr:plectin-like [Parambassis ranga]